MVMAAGPLAIGTYLLSAAEGSAGSSVLRQEVIFVGSSGGYLNFILEEICLVGVAAAMMSVMESGSSSIWN